MVSNCMIQLQGTRVSSQHSSHQPPTAYRQPLSTYQLGLLRNFVAALPALIASVRRVIMRRMAAWTILLVAMMGATAVQEVRSHRWGVTGVLRVNLFSRLSSIKSDMSDIYPNTSMRNVPLPSLKISHARACFQSACSRPSASGPKSAQARVATYNSSSQSIDNSNAKPFWPDIISCTKGVILL